MKSFIIVLISVFFLASCSKKPVTKEWGFVGENSSHLTYNKKLKMRVHFWDEKRLNQIVVYDGGKEDFSLFLSPDGEILVCMQYINGVPHNGKDMERIDGILYQRVYKNGVLLSKTPREKK